MVDKARKVIVSGGGGRHDLGRVRELSRGMKWFMT